MRTTLQQLDDVIERLYAHDELAAAGFHSLLLHSPFWSEAEREKQLRELLQDATTILEAYEEL